MAYINLFHQNRLLRCNCFWDLPSPPKKTLTLVIPYRNDLGVATSSAKHDVSVDNMAKTGFGITECKMYTCLCFRKLSSGVSHSTIP